MRLLICLILLCMGATLDGKYRCDYKHFPEAEGWLKLHRIPANWREARLRCHLEGGILASPLNSGLKQAMGDVINQTVGTECAMYTGIHATFSKGDFFSVDGVPLMEIPHTWAENEPDNYKDSESCIAMLSDGNLADVNCAEPYPYICYKKVSAYVQLNSCGTLDPGYTLDTRTGSCYKFHTVPRSWSRAYMACAAEGGYLAIINSDIETTILRDMYAKIPGSLIQANIWKDVVYVGFFDWEEHGEWLTTDGRTLSEAGFPKFDAGNPNNGSTGEFCGVMHRNGFLHDVMCEDKHVFICEKRPDSPLCPNDQN